jgi:CelD/BcsL family acetyltransferase involved in cellulose biosynthesis
MLRRLRVDRVEEPRALRHEWSLLAEETGNVFATWEWAATWWRHFGRGRLMVLRCSHHDGRVVAIVPLYVSRRGPLRVARFLGHGPGDALGPICAPEHRPAVAESLRRLVADRTAPWDVLVADHLPAADGWSGALGGTLLRREASPVVHLDPRGWEAWLGDKSSNFRGQVRRWERKLVREHDVSYRLADDPERLQADMDVFLALHRRRWQGESAAFSPAREAFHREFAFQALGRGWLRLRFLDVDGAPAAAWYNLRFGNSEGSYQTGRDPAWESYRVGFVLLADALRSAFREGLSEFRLLRGHEQYKDRFADEDPGLETFVVPTGATGRVAVATGLAVRRLPRAARDRVHARL